MVHVFRSWTRTSNQSKRAFFGVFQSDTARYGGIKEHQKAGRQADRKPVGQKQSLWKRRINYIKPDKISAEAKRGARYYKRGVLQDTGWKLWNKICCWLGLQANTGKAGKTAGLFRDVRILQRQAGSYCTKNHLEIRQVGTLDCYSTSVSNSVKRCLCQPERSPC